MKVTWLHVLVVTASAVPAQETIVRADIDQRGRLHIVTSQGRAFLQSPESEQTGVERVTISHDRRAIGWFALFPNCCTTYPVPLRLVVYRGGRRRAFGGDLALSTWAFADDGTRAAFRSETVHGGLGVHYELRDVSTGRLLASFDPGGNATQRAPAWVRALDSTTATGASARPVAGLPRIGIAVRDSAGGWCTEFVADTSAQGLPRGQRVTLVFPGPSGVPFLRAQVTGARHGQCPAVFPQPRWVDYLAYGIELAGRSTAGASVPAVALVVVGDTAWARGADGVVRADLDGDGAFEEARRCLADEGEHLTIWTPGPGGKRVRRWHEYFDWGAFTQRTCADGEDGRGRADR